MEIYNKLTELFGTIPIKDFAETLGGSIIQFTLVSPNVTDFEIRGLQKMFKRVDINGRKDGYHFVCRVDNIL